MMLQRNKLGGGPAVSAVKTQFFSVLTIIFPEKFGWSEECSYFCADLLLETDALNGTKVPETVQKRMGGTHILTKAFI